ncbi:hypothetical protein GCM10027294_13630 [Marinactinospora endophytica]
MSRSRGPARSVRRLSAVLTAAVVAFGASAAHADDTLDRAARALRDGGGLWVEDGAEGLDPQSREMIDARLAGAHGPVRVALTASGDPSETVRALAEEIGEPGVYVALTEERGITGDTTLHVSWENVDTGVDDGTLEEHLSYGPGGIEGQLMSLPELLGDDLLGEVGDAARTQTVYVHPAVRAGLPGFDADAVTGLYADVPGVRIAVLPTSVREEEELAEALLAPLGDDGVALLAFWEHGRFTLVPAAGPEATDPADLASALFSAGTGPDELAATLTEFAPMVEGDVVAAARAGLREGHLYVHPLLVDDLAEEERRRLDSELAGLASPVRIAVLPARAVEFEVRREEGSVDDGLARRVAGEGDDPVVLLTVDGRGRVWDRLTHGEPPGGVGEDGIFSLSTAVEVGYTPDSLDASLTELVGLLGEQEPAPPAGGGEGPGWPVLAVIAGGLLSPLLVLSTVLVLVNSRAAARRRREEADDAEIMARLRAEEAERVEAIRAENDRLITDLGEGLAGAASPVVDPASVFEEHLRGYEELKRDNRDAHDIDAIVAVRDRARAALAGLAEWDRRQEEGA